MDIYKRHIIQLIDKMTAGLLCLFLILALYIRQRLNRAEMSWRMHSRQQRRLVHRILNN